MEYKMIVLDLDDTLVHPDGTVSPGNRKALLEAQKKGVRVVLASGRPVYAMNAIAKQLHLEAFGGYMVSFNGAYVVDCATRQPVYSAGLNKAQVKTLYSFAQQQGAFIHTYTATEILTPQDNPYTQIEQKITGMAVVECDDFLQEIPPQVSKVLLLDEPQRLKESQTLLQQLAGETLSIAISKPFFLEVTPKNVDKGAALLRLCSRLGVSSRQMIAMGDSYNDLPMLKVAGLAVAMGNAPEEIKQKAHYVTDPCSQDGVARAVERFVLSDAAQAE